MGYYKLEEMELLWRGFEEYWEGINKREGHFQARELEGENHKVAK